MRTHLIDLDTFGVFDDDYDKFFKKRCEIFSRELRKRIIEQDVDRLIQAPAADSTTEAEMI